MKKIKILILLIFTFILSGCSVEYNLVINEDSSVNEEVVANENTHRLESMTRLKGEQACNYLFNMFKRPNENISINCYKKTGVTYGTSRTIHDSIEEYASVFNSDLFEKVNVSESDGKVTLTAIQKEKLASDEGKTYLYDNIDVNITVPYVVEENNADSIEKNVYTWRIKKGKEPKTIRIVYNEDKLPNRANVKINDKNFNFKYEYFVIGGIVILIGGIVLYVFVHNKKNNVI